MLRRTPDEVGDRGRIRGRHRCVPNFGVETPAAGLLQSSQSGRRNSDFVDIVASRIYFWCTRRHAGQGCRSRDVVGRARGRRSRRGRRCSGRRSVCSGVGRVGRLLARLAWEGREVHRDELADGIWLESLPRTWERTLSGVITRLRVGLAEAGVRGDVITFVDGRYSLVGGGDVHVDVRDAECDLVAAREAADRNDFRGCSGRGRRACWRCSVCRCCRGRTPGGSTSPVRGTARSCSTRSTCSPMSDCAPGGTPWQRARRVRRCTAIRCGRPGISGCCGF